MLVLQRRKNNITAITDAKTADQTDLYTNISFGRLDHPRFCTRTPALLRKLKPCLTPPDFGYNMKGKAFPVLDFLLDYLN